MTELSLSTDWHSAWKSQVSTLKMMEQYFSWQLFSLKSLLLLLWWSFKFWYWREGLRPSHCLCEQTRGQGLEPFATYIFYCSHSSNFQDWTWTRPDTRCLVIVAEWCKPIMLHQTSSCLCIFWLVQVVTASQVSLVS